MSGIRAVTFKRSLLAADYILVDKSVQDAAITNNLPWEARREVVALYRRLGGVLQLEDFAAGDWDFNISGGLKIELDEYLHFNRYRAATLTVPWRDSVVWSADYEDYCQKFENKCLQGQLPGMWANKRSEEMFGPSDPIGVLGELGSSRWKQRALYDAVKDAFACHGQVEVARISVIDILNGKSVQRELKNGRILDSDGLRALIEARTVSNAHAAER